MMCKCDDRRGSITNPVWTAQEAGCAWILGLPILLLLVGSAAMLALAVPYAVGLWILDHPFRAILYTSIIVAVVVIRRRRAAKR